MKVLDALQLFLVLLIVALFVAVPLALIFASGLLGSLASLLSGADLSSLSAEDILSYLQSQGPRAEPLPTDMQRYYSLKNASCAALSGDFLIATHEASDPQVYGLVEHIPKERLAADAVLSLYRSDSLGRIYVKGDMMKLVEEEGNRTTTRIWKGGRFYECDPSCTMSILTDEESDRYYDSLSSMRQDCHHLGGIALPPTVDLPSLLDIESLGTREEGGMRCELFQIAVNRTYAEGLLQGGGLDMDQRSLIWGLSHLDGPLEECLDESTGLPVLRSYELDLTDYYLFDYLPGGRMSLKQDLEMTYYSSDVADSFFDLPS